MGAGFFPEWAEKDRQIGKTLYIIYYMDFVIIRKGVSSFPVANETSVAA